MRDVRQIDVEWGAGSVVGAVGGFVGSFVPVVGCSSWALERGTVAAVTGKDDTRSYRGW